MSINYLITKYGTAALHNEASVIVYIYERTNQLYLPKNGFKEVTSEEYLKIYSKDPFSLEDKIKIEDKDYLVLDIADEYNMIGSFEYTMVSLFKDDFDKEIKIYSSDVTGDITNLIYEGNLKKEIKARIREVKIPELLDYSYGYNDRITHRITILFDSTIEKGDMIVYKEKKYRIKKINNYYMRDRLIMMDCEETLE